MGSIKVITGAKQKEAESSSKTRGKSPIATGDSAYYNEAEAPTTVETLIIPPNDKDFEDITNVNRQIMASREIAHEK